MGSTALGVQTVGFKLSTLKYQEVLQRLDQISAELNSPGKLVSIFLESLKEWETVRVDAQVLSSRFETTLQFFADADTNTKIRFQLRELEDEMSEVRGVAELGS
jgi:DNA-binding protein YbaB